MASLIKNIPLLSPALPEGDELYIDPTLMNNRAHVATLIAITAIGLVSFALLNPPAVISGALSYRSFVIPVYKAIIGLALLALLTKPIRSAIRALDEKITLQALDSKAVLLYMSKDKPSVHVMKWIADRPEAFKLLERQPGVIWNKPDENGIASYESKVVGTYSETETESIETFEDKLFEARKKLEPLSITLTKILNRHRKLNSFTIN